jgi:acyl carrier protein
MPAAEIKQFIARNFLFTEDGNAVRDDQSLMSTGTLDSTGILELIMFVEERFKLKIPDEDMLPENFDSVRAIADYIELRKKQAA